MNPVLLVILFVVSAVLGYVIIRNVPALLHTPLMSGMNALSGVTVLGAIIAAFEAKGTLAIILALAASSTFMYAANMYNLVKYLCKDGTLNLDESDDIVSGMLTTKDGKVVHAGALAAMGG